MNLTLNNFQSVMIEKAKNAGGIWENFGQNEISKLKDKYKYNDTLINDHCLTNKQIKIRQTIDALNEWAMTYNLTN